MANRPFPAARIPGVRGPLFVRRTACFRPSGERQRYSEACQASISLQRLPDRRRTARCTRLRPASARM